MKKVQVLFVTPKHKGFMRKVSELVCAATGSHWSHVAIYLFDGVFEAVMPQVMVSPLNKYAEGTYDKAEIITVELSDAGYEMLEKAAREMLSADVKYGYLDCIIAWWADFVSKRQASWFAKILNTRQTSMCAGTVAHLLYKGQLKCLKKVDGEIITPQELYSVLKAFC